MRYIQEKGINANQLQRDALTSCGHIPSRFCQDVFPGAQRRAEQRALGSGSLGPWRRPMIPGKKMGKRIPAVSLFWGGWVETWKRRVVEGKPAVSSVSFFRGFKAWAGPQYPGSCWFRHSCLFIVAVAFRYILCTSWRLVFVCSQRCCFDSWSMFISTWNNDFHIFLRL